MAIRVTESKIALKSGFEKYLRVDKDGVVKGIADAVGSMEQWEPVFEVNFLNVTKIITIRISGMVYTVFKQKLSTGQYSENLNSGNI